MSIWAWINLGKVAEVTTINPAGRYHANLQWVPVPDGTTVHVGYSYVNGVFAAPPAEPGPTLAQQAALLLATGLHVVSSATPTLNGTYACDDLSQMNIIAIETGLNAGKGFPPGNATTLTYYDMAGQSHVFNEDNFTNFATAVRDFVAACKACIAGGLQALPPAEATIP